MRGRPQLSSATATSQLGIYLCRPYGARLISLPDPGLPAWANSFRAYGAGDWAAKEEVLDVAPAAVVYGQQMTKREGLALIKCIDPFGFVVACAPTALRVTSLEGCGRPRAVSPLQ